METQTALFILMALSAIYCLLWALHYSKELHKAGKRIHEQHLSLEQLSHDNYILRCKLEGKWSTTAKELGIEQFETDTIMASELARKLNAAIEANGDKPVINSTVMPVPGGDGFSYVVYHKGDDHYELE